MSIRMVDPGSGLSQNSRLILDVLRERFDVDVLAPSQRAGGRGLRRDTKRWLERFAHTPEPLIESWKIAQQIIAVTDPGDVILVGDRDGLGGLLALIESSKPRNLRRLVWTAAGDGLTLETMLAAGTADHVEMPGASVIDWELVQYRASEAVLATSATAVELLDRVGVKAHLVAFSRQPASAPGDQTGTGIWVPGPVSRQGRSGDVLRAVASIPDVPIMVSQADAPDLVWNGTTWDTLAGIRTVLGNRLERVAEPTERPGLVILGDVLATPDAATIALHDSCVPILAVLGSVAEAMWPDVALWETSDDLSGLLNGVTAHERAARPIWDGSLPLRPSNDSRARRVSVGVPIFRNVAYLDECIESILDQTVQPIELLLMDDGSDSPEVDGALARWAEREPALIRVLGQPNRGVCVARNRMIEGMGGDAFVLLDQDDVLDPDFIRLTAQALREDDTLWAAASWTEFFGDYEGIEAKPPFDRRVGLRENPIVSTAALVDMRVRDEGIEFAPDLAFLYCEDWHYWSQIIAAGGRMGLVPEPLIRHRVHQASGGFQRTDLAHRIGKARAIEPLLSCDRSLN